MQGRASLTRSHRVFALLGVAAATCLCGLAARASPSTEVGAIADHRLRIGQIAVPFVPNAGKWDARTAFAARTLAGTLFVTTDGKLVYRLPAPALAQAGRRGRSADLQGPPAPGWSLVESFVDAHGEPLAAAPRGDQPSAAEVSHFNGNDADRHRTGIATWDRLNLGEVFDGINVQLRATGNNVEKIFTVAPERDPRLIRMRVDGATRIEIGDAGELIAHTGNGPVTYTAPIAYQEDADGGRTLVEVRYDVRSPGVSAFEARAPNASPGAGSGTAETGTALAPAIYAFAVGPYDRARPLVIDPLLQSTYLGGGGFDQAYALVVHPHTGDVYAAGYTESANLPGVTGGADSTPAGSEAFVSRFSSDLTSLLQSTFLGGDNSDQARALAVHPATGDIYVAGSTSSAAFPGTAGGAVSMALGNSDGFVSRLSSDLKTLHRSSYVGGSAFDEVAALAIHPATGEVYAGGSTVSTDLSGRAGGAQASYAGGTGMSVKGDGFISRFNSTLTSIVQSTYLGGGASDDIFALAIHPSTGDVYTAGYTGSTDLPGRTGGAQPTNGGDNSDGFVSRLNRNLTALHQSTYLGGSSADLARAVAVHPVTGEVYVAGETQSDLMTFPVTPPLGAQPALAGLRDGFVTRLNPALTSFNKWTFLGGSGGDGLRAIAIHAATGEVYVAGTTESSDLPQRQGGLISTYSNFSDAYVSRLTADLMTVIQSTYLGANDSDAAYGIAIHAATGDIYVAGETNTTSDPAVFPGVAGGAQATGGGGYDAYVSRMSSDLTAINTIPSRFAFIPQSNVLPNTLRTSNEIRLTGIPGANLTVYVTGQPGSQVCDTSRSGCCADPAPLPYCAGAFITGWNTSVSQVFDTDYISVRHTSQNPAGVAETNLIIGGAGTTFRSSTSNAAFACNLDMNGDNKLEAAVEGLVLIRAMFGLTGTAVTGGTGVTIAWDTLRQMLNAGCGTQF